MIVEFTGPPGSGKSTIARLLQGILEHDGLQAFTAKEAGRAVLRRTGERIPINAVKLYHAARLAGERPALVWLTLTSQLRRPVPLRHRHWAVCWFFNTCGLQRFLRENLTSGQIAIFDEGLVHRTVTLFSSDREKPPARAIEQYIGHVPRPDLLVVVQTPILLCIDRMRTRGHPARLRDRSASAAVRFVTHQVYTVECAVAEARRRQWQIICVNGAASLRSVEKQLQSGWAELAATQDRDVA